MIRRQFNDYFPPLNRSAISKHGLVIPCVLLQMMNVKYNDLERIYSMI